VGRQRRKSRRNIEQGDKLLAHGDLEEAEVLYRAALDADPESAEALYSMGALASHRRDPASALAWALRALELDPKHAGALVMAGDTLLALGRAAEGLPYLEEAERVAASDLISIEIALCLEATGNLKDHRPKTSARKTRRPPRRFRVRAWRPARGAARRSRHLSSAWSATATH
jgi:tetratricopeptide (TPR) repeat protein